MKRLLRTNSFFALLAIPLLWYVMILWYSSGTLLDEGNCAPNLFFQEEGSLAGKWWGGVAVLLLSLLNAVQNERFKFLQQSSILPSLLYLFACLRVVPKYGLNPTLIAAALIFLAITSMQNAILCQKNNFHVFWFGFFIVGAVSFNLNLILLIPASLVVLMAIGRFLLKDILAMVFGWLIAVYYILFILYMQGRLGMLSSMLEGVNIGFMIDLGNNVDAFREILLAFTILVFVILSYMFYVPSSYYIKRHFMAHIVLLLAVYLSFLLFGRIGLSYDFLYIAGLPIAWIVSHYMMFYKSRTGNVLCIIYFLLSLIPVNG